MSDDHGQTSVLITGASGAIGTALCERLVDTAYDVVGLDKRKPRWDVGVSVEQSDLTESPSLPEADVIVHLAAHSRVPPVVDKPDKAFRNIEMTEPVLEHARKNDADVIFASSREIYGEAIRPTEDEVSLTSANPYGGSKIACEALCKSYHRCYDLQITTIRFSNVYGRYDANTRVIPIFVALATAGTELTVFGDRKLLDFMHVDDATAAISAVIERRNALTGKAINAGSGAGTPLTKLAEIIADKIDACPGYRVKADRSGEVGRYVADISNATALLDWTPDTALEEGLLQTIEWYREHPDLLDEIRESVGGVN